MSPSNDSEARRRVPALKVHQWLPEWDQVVFDDSQYRARPPKHFYLFTIAASDLRALSGIFRRSTEGGLPRHLDLGIQRRHDRERSEELHEFVMHGFPWSALSVQRQQSGEYDDLKMPGWLPTAIVVNILRRDDTRNGKAVHVRDLIDVDDTSNQAGDVVLPLGFHQASWHPSGIAPIEVIDGQHRLWAFEERDFAEGFQLPVVAFHGLDRSWQAYLFYTINIKPKRINTSLAFDLYPLLRTENWLERVDDTPIYRETRAQEITEALWSYPASPWYQRIDMLGSRGSRMVTQAAWIRSLIATFVKQYESRRVKIGGLFGAPLSGQRSVLGWSRPQQSGFVIFCWQELQKSIRDSSEPWANDLREHDSSVPQEEDPAFVGRYSLLNTDQGVRAVLALFNDTVYQAADSLGLSDIEAEEVSEGTSEAAISTAIRDFQSAAVASFVTGVATSLASYDWRTSAYPGLSDNDRSLKARFRGNTGYRELRRDLLHHVATYGQSYVANSAATVVDELGF